jgi:WD40 repeat protein
MLSRHKLILSFSLQVFISIHVCAQKPTLYVQKGHVGPIYTVSYSPDGRILASAGEDRTIKLWDVATRREIRNLVGHDSLVTSLTISRDGKLLASGSMDARVMVWDIATGQVVWTHKHSAPILGTAFSPDGRFLGAWSSDLILWDVKRWQETKF